MTSILSTTASAPRSRFLRHLLSVGFAATALASAVAAESTLLNASYDVTREFYLDFNKSFATDWKARTGENVEINQSHGGSSKQARAVLDGLDADVVTMNQSTDIDILADKGLLSKEWTKKFPDNAAPYSSTILFLVRKGNPKSIKDWNDLVKEGVQVIIPHPKTSGNGRYSYIAAWGYALGAERDEAAAREFVKKLFANVPVLDAGGRGATTTFVQRGIGDVLLTFENEVNLAVRELGPDKFDIVVPSVSVLAESPVAVVDTVAKKHGTTKLAEAYLTHLYSPEGQELVAKHFFRPRSADVLKKHADTFPELKLLTIDEIAGGWRNALKVHFSDNGIFDQIYDKK